MKTSRRIGMATAAVGSAMALLLNNMAVSEKAERVNNHRTGPGRVTLYTLHKRIQRPTTKPQQSPRFMLHYVKRKRRMLARTEAHLPFTAEGQAALRFERREQLAA